MGKNIRITALILAVTLLLNMVVLPVRAEGEAAPQTLSGSDNTTQDTDQPSDSAEPLAEGGGDKQPDTDAGSGGQDDSGTNDEQDDSGNTNGQDDSGNTGGQDTPGNTGGQDDSGNTDEQDSSIGKPSEGKEEDSLLEEELLTEEILVNEQSLLTAMLLDEDVSALAEGEYRKVDEVFPDKSRLTEDGNGNITSIHITSGDDLIRLSNVDPALYQGCTLNIVSNEGGYNTTGSVSNGDLVFKGLGKAGTPFKGQVSIQNGSEGYPIVLARPLFNVLSDCAQIYSSGEVPKPGLLLQSTNADAQLATTVTHDDAVTVANQWQVKMSAPSASSSSVTPPLIKTIEKDAKVSLQLINETFSETSESGREVSSIQGSQHAGVLCAKMGASSSLTLISWSGTMPTVTAANGDAGLLVGTMASGAALSLGEGVSLTIPNVTASASAGGIVGSATDAIIPTISLENASATISGTHAGGLIGSYTYSGADGALSEVSQSISGITVNGSSNAGGVFGVLNTSDSATFTISSPSVSTTALSGSNVGGLIGQYSASNLAAALNVTSPSVSSTLSGNANAYGGLVGDISGASGAYMEIGTVTVNASGDGAKNYGGLVGSLSDAGHMVKVGNVTTSACKGSDSAGGLVGNMPSGVLWLSGQVETSVHAESNSANRGWILGKRGNTLVYNTHSYTSGWNFNKASYNDIGNWGQVVQVTGDLTGLVTDNRDHTVTVNDAKASCTIGTENAVHDFAAIALRFQLEEKGALKITGDITDDGLKGGNEKGITLNADVDLSGTGFTGFQRDYSSATVAKSVKLSGDNHSITFPDITVYCGGSHNRQGLFAKTEGLTVEGVTLKDGRSDTKKDACGIRLVAYGNATCAGALVAESSGAATLTNVKSYVNIEVTNNGNGEEKVSGLIASQNGGSAAFLNCEWDSDLTYSTNKGDNYHFAGGFLARAESKLNITVSDGSILGKISKATGKLYGGGLIGSLYDNNNANVSYQLGISGLTVDGVEIAASGCTYTGGLLGFEWMNTTADISGVTVKNSVFTGGSTSFGGLVYKGSGYWKLVDSGINFESGNTFTGKTTAAETSGLFVCHGEKLNGHSNALYLVILEGGYTIGDGSTTVTLPPDSYFDEIMGTSEGALGNGVVSIATPGDVIDPLDSSNQPTCNTYQNKTGTWKNPNTRYYYNLDTFRTNAGATDTVSPSGEINNAERMVLFSAYTHCFSGLQKYFYSKPGNITGNLDLTGYSYYPAEKGIYVDIKDADITFAYEEIEGREKDNKLLSNSNSQHYGMHTGIFTEAVNGNAEGDKTLTVSGLTLSGTVGGLGGNYGALIRDNTQGSNLTAKMILDISHVNLHGIRVSREEGDEVYPLLINSIGSFSTLKLSTVTAMLSGYDGKTAASSLIGHVGSDEGSGINLTFSDMALDGVADGDNKIVNGQPSIFTRALFLESFRYSDSNCSGVYNFEKNDSRYTVGRELSNTDNVTGAPSGRNNGNQYWFHNSTFENADLVCGDSGRKATYYANYLRYVHWGEQKDAGGQPHEKSHEIDVNVRTSGLLEGCGTYTHPYVITDGNQLKELAEALNAGGVKSGWKIRLYTDALTNGFSSNDVNCNGCKLYAGRADDWVQSDDNSKTASKSDVLKYLRNAYYVIRGKADDNNEMTITLSGSWAGLGDGTPDKAFSGVIVGEPDVKVIITPAESVQRFGGLIKYSQGSVVKNLKVEYTAAPTVTVSEAPTNTSNASFFGGVVGWCLGGDTIIDNVTVTYGENGKPSAGSHLAAVGGYVGMVGGAIIGTMEQYGGGVVFRGDTFLRPDIGTSEDSTSFYVNPYVGRVLDGYVISEDTELNNTDKNYKIPNFKPDDSYLEYDSTNKKLLVNNAEGLWLLSAIANSGASSMDQGDNLAYAKGKARIGTYEGISGIMSAEDLADEGYLGGVENADKKKSYLTQWDTDEAFCNLNDTPITIVLSKARGGFDMTIFGNGFRGIGASYGTNADNYSNHRLLQISGLVGNGNTVKLAQERKEYTEEKDNWTSIGSGLFVLLRVPSDGSFTASDLTLTGKTGITYYTGQQKSDESNIKNGDTVIGSIDTSNRLSLVGAGMLAGNLAKSTINSFSLDGISLTGTSDKMVTVNGNGVGSTQAGGLVGALWNNGTINSVTLTDCEMDNVAVSGRMNVGGFLGYVSAGAVGINYSQNKTLKNIQTTSTQNSPRNDDTYGTCGVGGLIGFNKSALTINASNATDQTEPPRLTLEHMKVTNSVNNTDTADKSHAGGLVGLWVEAQGGTAKIINVTMSGKIEIIGGGDIKPNTSVGGLAGAIQWALGTWNDDSGNCSLQLKGLQIASGKDSDEKNSSMKIKSGRQVGGLFGMAIIQNSFTIDDVIIGGDGCPVTISNTYGMTNQSIAALIGIALDAQNLSITNTQIINTDVLVKGDGDRGAGLVFGFIQNGPAKIDLRNLTLRDSAVVTQNESLRTGLLYGRINSSHAHTITGTNILVKNCVSGLMLQPSGNSYSLYNGTMDEFTPSNENVGLNIGGLKPYSVLTGTAGEVAGYTSDRKGILGGDSGGKTVKLVGVSIQQTDNTLPMKDFGTKPSGYVIRSDYTGAANGVASAVTTKPDGTTIPGVGALTGDGAGFKTVNNESKSIASQIWTDSKGSENLNLKYYSQIQETLNYLTPLVTGETIQFTDFKTAAESNIATNFPVISLQTSSDEEVNNSLFSCISLLSNWEEYKPNGTVNAVKKGYYNLSIQSYEWNGTVFVENTDDPSLRLGNDGKFYLNVGKYDNQKDQFNLIDVAYYDPSVASPNENSAVVYHLYIPVVVKKMFEFKFWAAAKMGTTYIVDDYDPLDAAAIGTHGEPVTALLNFEYQWTTEEWETAMESGQNLLWNFNHGISLSGTGLPAGTKLTLVDRNNSDKAFYRSLSSSTDYISFADPAFKDYRGTSWSADHKYLCDELKLTAAQDDEGTYYCFGRDGNNIVVDDTATLRDVNGLYYRPAKTDDKKENRYNLTVGATPISEQYYLTIQTPQTDSLVNVTIQCRSRLENPENGGLPSKRIKASGNHEYTRNGSENVVILGNFFNQEVTVETEREAELITVEDATIPLTLRTTIQVEKGFERDYVAYARGQRLYQCFELKLKKYLSPSGPENCNIVSDTELLVQFYRGGTAEENKVGGLYRYIVPSPQATFRLEFPGELKDGNIVPGIPTEALNSSSLDLYAKVQMNYTASAIQDQFPKRVESSDDSTGIAVFASSNLAYTSASLKNTTSRSPDIEALYNGTSRHYYCEDFAAASLHYYAYEDQDGVPAEGVSELGINGRDGDSFTINSVASYDVSALPNVEKAQALECTLTLSQRTGSSYENPSYSDNLSVSDYLDQLNVRVRYKQGGELIETDVKDARYGTVSFKLTNFDASVPIQIPVDLTVITGSRFEAEEKPLTYANYRLRLAVKLLDVNGNEISGSDVADYIIYTNAKIYPFVIK